MKVNHALLWDTDWKPVDFATNRFRRWYVARVLANGTAEDVRGLEEAFEDIPNCLDEPGIPRRVRRFWEWYLEGSGVRREHSQPGAARSARPA